MTNNTDLIHKMVDIVVEEQGDDLTRNDFTDSFLMITEDVSGFDVKDKSEMEKVVSIVVNYIKVYKS